MPQMIYPLPPNRVRRNYRGGAMLSRWDGIGEPVDGECPEDWIASTVEAQNPGLPAIEQEGLSTVETPEGPKLLTEVIAAAPEHLLGEAHVRAFGHDVGFLTKLLDAGMRLIIQGHPTAAFAQEHLGSRWGKMEAYLILDVRDGASGSLLLGFQHCPTPEEWKRIVLEQDKQAMMACFEPIPVHRGELWYVPGGVPHAIGEGLLVLEIMEPSDLVVRCEFEREGIVVPPEARFMNRDPDFALSIFKYEQQSPEEVRRRFCVRPEVLREEAGYTHERLFGREQSNCFDVQRVGLKAHAHYRFSSEDRIAAGLVTAGEGEIRIGDETLRVGKGNRFVVAAAAGGMEMTSHAAGLELVVCMPLLDAHG